MKEAEEADSQSNSCLYPGFSKLELLDKEIS